MKEQTIYVCEFCNTQFKKREDAIGCERYHHKANKIVGSKYHRAVSSSDGYPDTLKIEFDDGKTVDYRKS